MGAQIKEAGDRVKVLVEQAKHAVEGVDWTGADRDQFMKHFDGDIAHKAAVIQTKCHEFQERADRNASAQEATSSH